MKTATQLGVLISGFAVALTTVGGLGLWGLESGKASLQTVYDDRMVPVVQLAEIDRRMHQNRLALVMAKADPSKEQVAEAQRSVEANIAEIGKIWDAYMATYLTPEEKEIARKFAETRGQFVR